MSPKAVKIRGASAVSSSMVDDHGLEWWHGTCADGGGGRARKASSHRIMSVHIYHGSSLGSLCAPPHIFLLYVFISPCPPDSCTRYSAVFFGPIRSVVVKRCSILPFPLIRAFAPPPFTNLFVYVFGVRTKLKKQVPVTPSSGASSPS